MTDPTVSLVRVPTSDVRPGDRIACLLSDASAYPVVTGWADRTIDLTRYGQGIAVHRTFTVAGAPWWARDMLTVDLARETLIVERAQTLTDQGFSSGGERLPRTALPPVEQLEEWILDGVAQATDGCEVEPDGQCEHGCPSWLLVAEVI